MECSFRKVVSFVLALEYILYFHSCEALFFAVRVPFAPFAFSNRRFVVACQPRLRCAEPQKYFAEICITDFIPWCYANLGNFCWQANINPCLLSLIFHDSPFGYKRRFFNAILYIEGVKLIILSVERFVYYHEQSECSNYTRYK